MTLTPNNHARFWSAWFCGLMCGVVICGLSQAVATTDLGQLVDPSLAELRQQLQQERSDKLAWQLESKRWMKRWGECRDGYQ